jgi:hypothetical protein
MQRKPCLKLGYIDLNTAPLIIVICHSTINTIPYLTYHRYLNTGSRMEEACAASKYTRIVAF